MLLHCSAALLLFLCTVTATSEVHPAMRLSLRCLFCLLALCVASDAAAARAPRDRHAAFAAARTARLPAHKASAFAAAAAAARLHSPPPSYSSPISLAGVMIEQPNLDDTRMLEEDEIRIRWSAATVQHSAEAPPLLYTLFAQTADEATEAISLCHTNSDQQQQPGCNVSLSTFPLGEPLQLYVLTECDFVRMAVATLSPPKTSLPTCPAAMSRSISFTLPAHLSSSSAAAARKKRALPSELTFSLPALEGVQLVSNDTVVRAALFDLFNQTRGQQWSNNKGWNQPNVPVCNWLKQKNKTKCT